MKTKLKERDTTAVLYIKCPTRLHAELKVWAFQNNLTMTKALIIILKEWLKARTQKPKKEKK